MSQLDPEEFPGPAPMTPHDILHAIAHRQAQEKGAGHYFVELFGAPVVEPPPEAGSRPEALGSLFEQSRDTERATAFAELISGRDRHEGSTGLSTTQRFTPPWIARWLVEQSVAACDGDPWPCIDPACGGGQLLASMYVKLRELGRSPRQILETDIVGYDVDAAAADVSRWTLWLMATAELPAGSNSLPAPRIYTPSDASDLDAVGSLGPLEALRAETSGAIEGHRFGVVVANPPYMGARHLAPQLRAWLRDHYGAFAGDLYTAFLRRCTDLCRTGGGMAILCQHSFLFLKQYRRLRAELLSQIALREVLHLGAHAFEAMGGEKASVVALAASVGASDGDQPRFVDLTDLRRPSHKQREWESIGTDGVEHPRVYRGRQAVARARAGDPLAYWWPESLAHILDSPHKLRDFVDVPGCSNKTADNKRFVRYWWQVDPTEVAEGRWVPYAKGGPHRKWYGNMERVVDWSEQARTYYRDNPTSNLLPERYWFREGITWSDFGGVTFSARWLPPGSIFDMAGPALFVRDDVEGPSLTFWLALLNSPFACHLLNADNPTIHYQVSNLRSLPLPPDGIEASSEQVRSIDRHGRAAREIALELAGFDPWDPRFAAPLLSLAFDTLGGESLAELTAWALDHRAGRLSALRTHELAIAEHVEGLYQVPRGEASRLDARLRTPRHRHPSPSDLVDDALVFVALAADGMWPKRPHGSVAHDALGETHFGSRAWREIVDLVGADWREQKRFQSALSKVTRGQALHPSRRRR